MTDKIRHPDIDLSLTAGEWKLMGYYVGNDGIVRVDHSAPHMDTSVRNTALLIAAASDTPAATYMETIQAERHDRKLLRAVHRLANAIQSHGQSIVSRETSDILADVMSRLTDRTQWAIRSQLKGSGMLPS